MDQTPGLDEILDEMEAPLAYALERLKQGDAADALPAMRACRAYLELHAAPHYAHYSPTALIRTHVKELENERRLFEIEPVPDCVGDPGMVLQAVRLLLENIQLEADAVAVAELSDEDGAPQLAVSFDGPGAVPACLSFGGYIKVAIEQLDHCWTLATRGGRIDTTPNGVLLRLTGTREPPKAATDIGGAVERVREAEQRVRLTASEQGTPVEEAAAAVHAALALADGCVKKEVGDLHGVVHEAVDREREREPRSQMAVEVYCDPGVPPVMMQRKQLVRFFRNVLRYARDVLPEGGSVAILADSEPAARKVTIIMTANGHHFRERESFRGAAMRRSIVEIHGGTLETRFERSGMTWTVELPDSVGKVLDGWLPGWEALSSRSCQILRLLKSGGPTPPEEFLLDGVLEEELERWLMPRLTNPAVVNIAHELRIAEAGLPGGSKDRLDKAITQIERGKPRKEIVKPAYAGEILWAFRGDERRRQAIGIGPLNNEELHMLCEGLVNTPPAYLFCLKLIAKTVRANAD